MAKHRSRTLRAIAEEFRNRLVEIDRIADELEAQARTAKAVGTQNTGETAEECPWNTGDTPRDFYEFYRHEIAAKSRLPKPNTLSATRRFQVACHIGDDDLLRRENWPILADKILNSDRGCLRGDAGWPGATFDWVINPDNLIKILEGNYDPKEASAAGRDDAERQLNARFEADEQEEKT